jgi:uroporphyrinogen decarboxylase
MERLTPRERVRRILNHQEADRPAIDLGSTVVTGTSAWTYRRLKQLLRIPGDTVRVHEMFQMLAEVEEPVLDAFHVDFAMLPKEEWLLGLRYGTWKHHTFWDGQTFEVPTDFNPVRRPDGTLEVPFERGGPLNMRLPAGGWFFDRIPETAGDPLEADHIPRSEWKFQSSLPDGLLRSQEARAKALHQSTDRALVAEAPLMTPLGYGGMYYWSMKMLTEPEYCYDYMMAQGEATAACFSEFMQAVGQYVQVVTLNLADFGTQQREFFRPQLFQEFFVPSWLPTTRAIHQDHPHVKTWIHTCGSVAQLMPYFIEAGVDCVNPVQWTADGMDLRELKARYGNDVVFWGGAVNTQRTLPFGSPEDVRKEVTDVLDIMTPGGGYVGCAVHNILPEVPPENILAMYETMVFYND